MSGQRCKVCKAVIWSRDEECGYCRRLSYNYERFLCRQIKANNWPKATAALEEYLDHRRCGAPQGVEPKLPHTYLLMMMIEQCPADKAGKYIFAIPSAERLSKLEGWEN